MKIILFFTFTLIGIQLNAQFQDNMESYTEGQPISNEIWTHWGCGGGEGCEMMSTSEIVHTGNLSGVIPSDGTTDAVLDLNNKIFGHWKLEFWMYVPSGKEAYWNIKSCVPICTQDWGIHFFFNQNNENPGNGYIFDSSEEQIDFTFPHDTWFRVYMDWDIYTGINQATWSVSIDLNEILPLNTPFTNSAGEYPISLGGIEFFSINPASNLYYVDNVIFCDEVDPPTACTILGLEANDTLNFIISPNPIKDILTIQNTSNSQIKSINIYNALGKLVLQEKKQFKNIDVTQLSNGLLFVTIETEKGNITKKILKE